MTHPGVGTSDRPPLLVSEPGVSTARVRRDPLLDRPVGGHYHKRMPAERVTSTTPAEDAAARAAVPAGHAPGASADHADPVYRRLGRNEALAKLDALWGPLPPEALAWARELFATHHGRHLSA